MVVKMQGNHVISASMLPVFIESELKKRKKKKEVILKENALYYLGEHMTINKI